MITSLISDIKITPVNSQSQIYLSLRGKKILKLLKPRNKLHKKFLNSRHRAESQILELFLRFFLDSQQIKISDLPKYFF